MFAKTFEDFTLSRKSISHAQVDILRDQRFRSVDLVGYGITFHIPCLANGRRSASFDFVDLCAGSYGAADYIELSKIFHVVAIAKVPKLSLLQNRNEVCIKVICVV